MSKPAFPESWGAEYSPFGTDLAGSEATRGYGEHVVVTRRMPNVRFAVSTIQVNAGAKYMPRRLMSCGAEDMMKAIKHGGGFGQPKASIINCSIL